LSFIVKLVIVARLTIEVSTMKKDIHPPYQEVLFVDSSTGSKFVIGTTMNSDKKEVFEGTEYPVIHVPVSSASHPFFTGSQQFIDSEGRVDKFMKRYGGRKSKKKASEVKEDAPKEDASKEDAPKEKSKEETN